MVSTVLTDAFNRKVTYLRLSVTDRCNFRCTHCMGEHVTFSPKAQLLTLEEWARIGQLFVELGVTKIRLTGGEPLERRGLLELVSQLDKIKGLHELAITTNGAMLDKFAEPLKAAGVQRLNINLDSLKPHRFKQITRFGNLSVVLRGIDAAVQAGFKRLKLNTVVLRNRNHDEITDLVQFAIQHKMDISFIEETPLNPLAENYRKESYYSCDEMRRDLANTFTLLPTTVNSGGPARYLQVAHTQTRVGFIMPHVHNFCANCNRVQVTPEGRLLLCMNRGEGIDLRHLMHTHSSSDEPIKRAIITAIRTKPKGYPLPGVQSTHILHPIDAISG